MKTKYISIFLVVAAMLSSCDNFEWDFDHETTLSAFEISSTDQSASIVINYADSTENFGNEIKLEWSKSEAADYSTVFYEVLFYNPENLETPAHRAMTTKGQIENFLVLTEKELNVIAERVGIPQSGTGDIIWKVHASNGIAEKASNNNKKITVSRPDGFAYYPEKMLITGSAVVSEKALVMKRIVQREVYTGEYELFFYLSEGDFYLTEQGTGRRFYITEEGRFTELFGTEKETQKNTILSKNKIHRVKIDMKKSTAIAVVIESVAVWYSGTNDILGEMQQEDASIPYWTLTKQLELVNNAGFPDYRYKFRIGQKNMKGESSFSFWGYSTTTAPSQGANTPASYFYLYEVDDSRSNFCYKFSQTGHDQSVLNFGVDFRAESDAFEHSITIVEQ